jgi:hypothetical protein
VAPQKIYVKRGTPVSKALKKTTRQAVRTLNKAAGAKAFTLTGSRSAASTVVKPGNRGAYGGNTKTGFTGKSQGRSVVQVNNKLAANDRLLVAHELGHSVGMRHSKGEKLMNPASMSKPTAGEGRKIDRKVGIKPRTRTHSPAFPEGRSSSAMPASHYTQR